MQIGASPVGCGPQDGHIFYVEAELSPLMRLSRLWAAVRRNADDLRCCWGGYRYPNENLGEWVGRSVEGCYYKSGVPLTSEDGTPIPIGSNFVCSRLEKNLPFCAEGQELLDEDMVGDRATFETLHPETGERIAFTFWAHQQGFPQFQKVNNQMVCIAIAATGL